jgi:asparagine synthase (glutamine-hydrolysing)
VCGIAGIVGYHSDRQELLDKMLTAQAHRGPDSTGKWKDDSVILGHNRLSIIDLSPQANQPMVSNCGQFVIVLNGEIYNYKELKSSIKDYVFRTSSDTEVVLAAYKEWGSGMLNRLNGMFSFAIWDTINKTLFAARDRFGVKPFYYHFNSDVFYFASEIKTLWAAGVKKEENFSVFSRYLVYGSYGLPEETFWREISQLPPGHFFEADLKNIININPIRWYDFEGSVKSIGKKRLQDLKEEYFSLLRDSIRLRFRADVPVGFNISGGLDSSILLALINVEYPGSKDIEAFTFYTDSKDYDELPWVEDLIRLTKNPLNRVLLRASDVTDLIEKVGYFEDEPFGGFPTLAYSLIFGKAKEKGIIVLLDGQGMDEAWAGYDYYHNNSGFMIQGAKSSPVKPEVLDPEFIKLAVKESFPTPFDDKLQNLQYRDLFYTKIQRALRFNDRISMMHSTELREPFLDYRLVELAFAQPSDIKIKNGLTKWLLRDFVKDILGNSIALAPKRPLQTPQREWIACELENYCSEKISDFANLDFVKGSSVSHLWELYKNGQNDNSFFIWQWINLVQLLSAK